MIEEREMGPEGVEEIPPISEIRDFEFPPEDLFTDRVRRSIDRREAGSSFGFLTTNGFFTLLLELFSTLSGIFHSAPHRDDGEKES